MQPELFLYQCSATRRDEAVPESAKTEMIKTVDRVFNKENSVFKTWVEDDADVLKKICDHDFYYWKVGPKMIKDDEDRASLEKIVKDNIVYLKWVFTYLMSRSLYPAIASLEYTHFVNKS